MPRLDPKSSRLYILSNETLQDVIHHTLMNACQDSIKCFMITVFSLYRLFGRPELQHHCCRFEEDRAAFAETLHLEHVAMRKKIEGQDGYPGILAWQDHLMQGMYACIDAVKRRMKVFDREIEVLQIMSKGKKSKQVGDEE